MRIPHVIELNTYEAYKTSAIAEKIKQERNKQLSADCLTWDYNEFPKLSTLCIQTIATNFEKCPIYNDLLDFNKVELLEYLSTELDLYIAVPVLQSEYYWEKRYNEHFGSKSFKKHLGWTWKCVYLEQYLARMIEQAQPQDRDEEFATIQNMLDLCAKYIHILNITQLQEWQPPKTMLKEDYPLIYPVTHINFEPILKKLSNLQELQICIGMNNVEMNYNSHMFQVDPQDCEHLGAAVSQLKHLKLLKLHNSAVRDAHMKLMVRKLLSNTSLEELDLSYCEIGDMGAHYIGMLLNTHEKLKILNLRCNKIGAEGVQGIAWALLMPEGTYLQRLDLSLNPLGHEGMLNICKALVRGPTPKELSLAGCGINGHSAYIFSLMLKINTSLRRLDIGGNDFGVEAGRSVLESLEQNKHLCHLQMGHTNIPEEIQLKIKQKVKRNQEINPSTRKSSINFDFIKNLSKFSNNEHQTFPAYEESSWYNESIDDL